MEHKIRNREDRQNTNTRIRTHIHEANNLEYLYATSRCVYVGLQVDADSEYPDLLVSYYWVHNMTDISTEYHI
jgi:hypothetical protein